MIEVQGKYCTAKVYTDNIEEAAYRQVLNLMNQPFAAGSNCAIMPDVHAGVGCVIGLTAKITDKVVPNLVGVDIGCGMLVVMVDSSHKFDLHKVDEIVHEGIPAGMKVRDTRHKFAMHARLDELIAPCNKERLERSIGTLGGGNHFIEIDVDDAGNHYFVIHSGSRHLGIEVCKHYQNMAIQDCRGNLQDAEVIRQLKTEGKESEIEETLRKSRQARTKIPDELAYLQGQHMEDYLHDMGIAQEYAALNREAMMDVILHGLGLTERDLVERFCTVHNYIDLKHRVMRKGAISLQHGELAIIPMNMRDGSLVVRGKGNPEWNCSGPHGAGRLMSRSKAKETLSLQEFKDSMGGIFSTTVGMSTIDESPMAYKPMSEIMENIGPTAEVVQRIVPIYNFKASE